MSRGQASQRISLTLIAAKLDDEERRKDQAAIQAPKRHMNSNGAMVRLSLEETRFDSCHERQRVRPDPACVGYRERPRSDSQATDRH